MPESSNPVRLELVRSDDVVEIVDTAVGEWLVRFEPTTIEPIALDAVPRTVLAALAPLVDGFVALQGMMRESTGLRVAFSPGVQRLIASGDYRLMQSVTGALPKAVNVSSGRIVETARVVNPETAAAAGGAAALGVTGVVAWPVLLAAAVGTVAAISEQRWLERTFGELTRSVQRIEHRLRDEDAGVLLAANEVIELAAPRLGQMVPVPQVRAQLAIAQFEVNRIYAARRQFVERWKHSLEGAQTEQEARTGERSRSPWAQDVASELADRKSGLFDEIVLFLQALVVRARMSAANAAVIAAEGDGETALRLLQTVDGETRTDYHDLHNRVRALARIEPSSNRWQQVVEMGRRTVPFVAEGDSEVAHRLVVSLNREMEEKVGAAIPERDRVVALDLGEPALSQLRSA